MIKISNFVRFGYLTLGGDIYLYLLRAMFLFSTQSTVIKATVTLRQEEIIFTCIESCFIYAPVYLSTKMFFFAYLYIGILVRLKGSFYINNLYLTGKYTPLENLTLYIYKIKCFYLPISFYSTSHSGIHCI